MNWQRSNKCGGGECIEVAFDAPDAEYPVAMRNSKVPGEILWFTLEEWEAFINGVKDGDFAL